MMYKFVHKNRFARDKIARVAEKGHQVYTQYTENNILSEVSFVFFSSIIKKNCFNFYEICILLKFFSYINIKFVSKIKIMFHMIKFIFIFLICIVHTFSGLNYK